MTPKTTLQIETTTPADPRESLRDARTLLGDSYMCKLFALNVKGGNRELQRWTAEPGFVSEDSIRENYLEKHERLLKRLMREEGGTELARSIVARHMMIVGLVPLVGNEQCTNSLTPGALARYFKETGEALTAMSSAIADQRLDPDEAKSCIKEILENVQVSTELVNALRPVADGAKVVNFK